MRNVKLLTRDELIGFAKSKVMLVLWIGLPALALIMYLLPILLDRAPSSEGPGMASFVSLLVSSLAGTVAAIMVAVDMVSERNRGVYQLLVIRPLPREAIIWAKYIAVVTCVTLACVAALLTGVVVDLVAGHALPKEAWYGLGRAFGSTAGVVAISTAVGVFVGALSRSILVAVILILYVGQNLAIIPMVPTYFGLQEWYWAFMAATTIVALGVVFASGMLFRRAEL